MTTLQIHMTMAALGVVVCLAFLALVSYRHYPAFKRTLLGFIVGGLVALSPFIASLGGYVTDGLLPKSMVLSFATVLSGLLFYTLSRWPIKEHLANGKSTYDPSRKPVVLTADDQSAVDNPMKDKQEEVKEDVPTLLLPDTTVDGFPTLELEQETENDPIYDVSDDDIFDAPESMKTLSEEDKREDTFDINEAFAKNTDTAATNEIDTTTNDFAFNDNDGNSDDIDIDNSMIFELTGQHEIPSDVGVPLPESKQREQREQQTEAAPVVPATENEKSFAGPGTNEIQNEIGFETDDLTDKLDKEETPVFDDAPSRNAIARSVELDSVLQGKLDELDATLTSLDTPTVATSDIDSDDTSDKVNSLIPAVDADSFAAAESDVNTATENLMALQRKVLEQNNQQQQLITELKQRSAEQLESQRKENIRMRELIENTSKLTREMVDQQQTLRDAVAQEKAARLKSEASAKKSLEIAQSAIARLSKAKAASRVSAIKFKSD